jgi:TonB family protein
LDAVPPSPHPVCPCSAKMGNIAEFSSQQDRRFFARRSVRSLAYVDLGDDNGGIVLNMSEGGLAVHSAVTLSGVHLPHIRFQLPQSPDWVEARGEIAWTSETKTLAGILFIGLPDRARQQIRDWVFSSSRTEDVPPAPDRTEVTRIPPPPATSVGHAATRESVTRSSASPVRAFISSPETSSARPAASIVSVRTTHSALGSTKSSTVVHNEPAIAKNAGQELNLRLSQAAPTESRASWLSWSGFLAVLAALAALSFFVGLTAGRTAGHGDIRRLLAKLSGSAASANSASSQPRQSTSAGVTQAALSPAAPPTIPNGRVTITSRMYVPVPTPTLSDASQVKRLQVGALDHRVEPQYPPDAAKQRAEGTVQLHVTIGASGAVDNVTLLSGPPALVQSATDAVRQWRYKPTLVDGKPTGIEADIAIVFWLPPPAQPGDQQPKR